MTIYLFLEIYGSYFTIFYKIGDIFIPCAYDICGGQDRQLEVDLRKDWALKTNMAEPSKG